MTAKLYGHNGSKSGLSSRTLAKLEGEGLTQGRAVSRATACKSKAAPRPPLASEVGPVPALPLVPPGQAPAVAVVTLARLPGGSCGGVGAAPTLSQEPPGKRARVTTATAVHSGPLGLTVQKDPVFHGLGLGLSLPLGAN